MKSFQFVKNIFSCCFVLLISQTAIAGNSSNIACPTTEQVSQFNYGAAFPYGFDKHSQRAKFIIGADEAENETSASNGDWLLFVYPVSARQTDDVRTIAQTIIEHLVPITPFAFQFNLVDDLQLPFCVYSLPGHDDVNALAYFVDNGFDDDYDDDDNDFNSKIRSKVHHNRLRMMKIVKHVQQMLLK